MTRLSRLVLLALALPLPALAQQGTSPPAIVGTQPVSVTVFTGGIQSASVNGAGHLLLMQTNGVTLDAGALPSGSGGGAYTAAGPVAITGSTVSLSFPSGVTAPATLPKVAATGAYADLSGLPSIPAPGLLPANNLSDVAAPAAARGNLGLGSAALANTSAFDASGAAASVASAAVQKSANLSDVANAATARANIGAGTSNLVTGTTTGTAADAALTNTAIANEIATARANETAALNAANTKAALDDPTGSIYGLGPNAVLRGTVNLELISNATGTMATTAGQSPAQRIIEGTLLQQALNVVDANGLKLICPGNAVLEYDTGSATYGLQVPYAGSNFRADLSARCSFRQFHLGVPILTIADPTNQNNGKVSMVWHGGTFDYGVPQGEIVNGYITGSVLTVSAITSTNAATIQSPMAVTGTGIYATPGSLTITSQASGTAGGAGNYNLSSAPGNTGSSGSPVQIAIAYPGAVGLLEGAAVYGSVFDGMQENSLYNGDGTPSNPGFDGWDMGPRSNNNCFSFNNYYLNMGAGGALNSLYRAGCSGTGNVYVLPYFHNGSSPSSARWMADNAIFWGGNNYQARSDDRIIGLNEEHLIDGNPFYGRTLTNTMLVIPHFEDVTTNASSMVTSEGAQLVMDAAKCLECKLSGGSGRSFFKVSYGGSILLHGFAANWTSTNEIAAGSYFFQGTAGWGGADDLIAFDGYNLEFNDVANSYGVVTPGNSTNMLLEPNVPITLDVRRQVGHYVFDPLFPTTDHCFLTLNLGTSPTIYGDDTNADIVVPAYAPAGGTESAHTITLSNLMKGSGTGSSVATSVGTRAIVHWNSGTHQTAATVNNSGGTTITTIPTSNTSSTNFVNVENGTNFVNAP